MIGIGLVIAVFVIGQVIEGNFLTPKLVGDRVNLHAVWILFALMAGGALFGFVGILLVARRGRSRRDGAIWIGAIFG